MDGIAKHSRNPQQHAEASVLLARRQAELGRYYAMALSVDPRELGQIQEVQDRLENQTTRLERDGETGRERWLLTNSREIATNPGSGGTRLPDRTVVRSVTRCLTASL